MDAEDNQPTNQQPKDVVWQLVVARPRNELESLVVYLKSKCTRLLGMQHDADPEGTPNGINRTHCHFQITNYKHTKQALSKFLNSIDIEGSDNFGILTKCPKTKTDYDEHILNRYILKGLQYDPAITIWQGYDEAYIQSSINDYHTHVRDKATGLGVAKDKKRTLIQYQLKVETPKERKARISDLLQAMKDKLKSQYDTKEKYAYALQNDVLVFQVIADVLDEHNEKIGNYKVLDFYDTIMRQEARGKWIESMVGLLEKRKPRV